jgi:predicted transcriptional regulator
MLLAIHPRFARLILRGEKTFELRRRAPGLRAGSWIALYATAPEQALTGLVRAEEILVGHPESLWDKVRDGCALEPREYWKYYAGASRAVGIRLADPIPFSEPLRLAQLRRIWPGFRPPRSFCYLDGDLLVDVWNHAGLCALPRQPQENAYELRRLPGSRGSSGPYTSS